MKYLYASHFPHFTCSCTIISEFYICLPAWILTIAWLAYKAHHLPKCFSSGNDHPLSFAKKKCVVDSVTVVGSFFFSRSNLNIDLMHLTFTNFREYTILRLFIADDVIKTWLFYYISLIINFFYEVRIMDHHAPGLTSRRIFFFLFWRSMKRWLIDFYFL